MVESPKDGAAEAESPELEMIPTTTRKEGNLTLKRFEAILELGDNAEKVANALDKVRRLVLNRALPGDFVIHGDKVCCGSAGAERMRALIGLAFVNWRKTKVEWEDKNGKAFTWEYIADMEMNGEIVEESVEFRVSSRDKFHGYENGAWKELADVSEKDIQMAAHRGVRKEGTLGFLGLRSLPNDEEALKALGLDPKKIKAVERGRRGERKVDAAPAGEPVTIKEVKPFTKPDQKDADGKVVKRGYTRYDVFDTEGRKASTFDKKVAEFAQKMVGKKVLMPTNVTEKGVDIVEISAYEEKKPYESGADDQEPNT